MGDRRHLGAEDLTFVRWGLENVEQMLLQRPQARKKFMLDKLYIMYRCSIGKKYICLVDQRSKKIVALTRSSNQPLPPPILIKRTTTAKSDARPILEAGHLLELLRCAVFLRLVVVCADRRPPKSNCYVRPSTNTTN